METYIYQLWHVRVLLSEVPYICLKCLLEKLFITVVTFHKSNYMVYGCIADENTDILASSL